MRHRGSSRETTQSPDSIMFACNTFIKYFILILIIEGKFLRTILLLFACSEAELRLTVITIRYDLQQKFPKYRSNGSI